MAKVEYLWLGCLKNLIICVWASSEPYDDRDNWMGEEHSSQNCEETYLIDMWQNWNPLMMRSASLMEQVSVMMGKTE